jgi:hypothetical protein
MEVSDVTALEVSIGGVWGGRKKSIKNKKQSRTGRASIFHKHHKKQQFVLRKFKRIIVIILNIFDFYVGIGDVKVVF